MAKAALEARCVALSQVQAKAFYYSQRVLRCREKLKLLAPRLLARVLAKMVPQSALRQGTPRGAWRCAPGDRQAVRDKLLPGS